MNNYLYHHGILGQKWGVRRYQNPDGSLTAAGKNRYAKDTTKKLNKLSMKSAEVVYEANPYKKKYEHYGGKEKKYIKKK